VQAIEHGLSSSFEEEAIDARVAKTLEDWEKKNMPGRGGGLSN
jgi:hypothetical protein